MFNYVKTIPKEIHDFIPNLQVEVPKKIHSHRFQIFPLQLQFLALCTTITPYPNFTRRPEHPPFHTSSRESVPILLPSFSFSPLGSHHIPSRQKSGNLVLCFGGLFDGGESVMQGIKDVYDDYSRTGHELLIGGVHER